MAQIALAWVLRNPNVSAPIVGATKPHHLPEAAAALELHLTDEEVEALERHYTGWEQGSHRVILSLLWTKLQILRWPQVTA